MWCQNEMFWHHNDIKPNEIWFFQQNFIKSAYIFKTCKPILFFSTLYYSKAEKERLANSLKLFLLVQWIIYFHWQNLKCLLLQLINKYWKYVHVLYDWWLNWKQSLIILTCFLFIVPKIFSCKCHAVTWTCQYCVAFK